MDRKVSQLLLFFIDTMMIHHAPFSQNPKPLSACKWEMNKKCQNKRNPMKHHHCLPLLAKMRYGHIWPLFRKHNTQSHLIVNSSKYEPITTISTLANTPCKNPCTHHQSSLALRTSIHTLNQPRWSCSDSVTANACAAAAS